MTPQAECSRIRIAGLYVTGDKGILLAAAGRDLTLSAADIQNAGPNTVLQAGRILTLGTVITREQIDIVGNNCNHAHIAASNEVGSHRWCSGGRHRLGGGWRGRWCLCQRSRLQLVNTALQRLNALFDAIYAEGGRTSIAPEKLMALMDKCITIGNAWNLRPGVALISHASPAWAMSFP